MFRLFVNNEYVDAFDQFSMAKSARDAILSQCASAIVEIMIF